MVWLKTMEKKSGFLQLLCMIVWPSKPQVSQNKEIRCWMNISEARRRERLNIKEKHKYFCPRDVFLNCTRKKLREEKVSAKQINRLNALEQRPSERNGDLGFSKRLQPSGKQYNEKIKILYICVPQSERHPSSLLIHNFSYLSCQDSTQVVICKH